jgi:hypothetical protein
VPFLSARAFGGHLGPSFHTKYFSTFAAFGLFFSSTHNNQTVIKRKISTWSFQQEFVHDDSSQLTASKSTNKFLTFQCSADVRSGDLLLCRSGFGLLSTFSTTCRARIDSWSVSNESPAVFLSDSVRFETMARRPGGVNRRRTVSGSTS